MTPQPLIIRSCLFENNALKKQYVCTHTQDATASKYLRDYSDFIHENNIFVRIPSLSRL